MLVQEPLWSETDKALVEFSRLTGGASVRCGRPVSRGNGPLKPLFAERVVDHPVGGAAGAFQVHPWQVSRAAGRNGQIAAGARAAATAVKACITPWQEQAVLSSTGRPAAAFTAARASARAAGR